MIHGSRTPKRLLKGDYNVYQQIALALKPAAWRRTGLLAVLGKLAESAGERKHFHHCAMRRLWPRLARLDQPKRAR